MTEPAGEVTVLLGRWQGGDPDAMEKLLPIVYKELRRMAGGARDWQAARVWLVRELEG